MRSRLKVILAEKDISLKELAAQTRLSYGTVCAIANGRKPHIDSAYQIAKALGIHINRVFPGLYTYSQVNRKIL